MTHDANHTDDGNEGAAEVSSSSSDELAMAVERVTKESRRLRTQKERGSAFHPPWGQDIIDANNALADALDLILSRLASQEEMIRADVEALNPFADMNVIEPSGVIVGLERWHFERARAALTPRQVG